MGSMVKERAFNFLTILLCLICVPNVAAAACVPPKAQDVQLASKSRDGADIFISAHLLKPPGAGPFPALILLHGSPGGLQPGYLCIAEKMRRWGYVTLVIDSNSAPSRSRDHSIGSYLDTEQAQDVHQGWDYLAGLAYVDRKRVGVVGWSAGGQAALASVSSHRTFYNGTWHGVAKKGAFAAAVAIYPVCYSELNNLSAPLLILIGAKDQTVSASFCQNMVESVRPAADIEFALYPEAGHGFDGPWSGWSRQGHAASDSREKIRQFLAKHMN